MLYYKLLVRLKSGYASRYFVTDTNEAMLRYIDHYYPIPKFHYNLTLIQPFQLSDPFYLVNDIKFKLIESISHKEHADKA